MDNNDSITSNYNTSVNERKIKSNDEENTSDTGNSINERKSKSEIELYTESDKELKFGNAESDYKIQDRMLEDHTYPSPSQADFQLATYIKRDFYIHGIPPRPEIPEDKRLVTFREKCKPEFKLTESQVLLSNFINPNTPYRGLLIYWGTGVGKSASSIAIAEKFKPMVEKYGTRIHVLVPGPLNKQNFLSEIINSTGETYLKSYQDKTVVVDEIEKAKMRKNALAIVNQYYRIMSYRSFYKKVLGEKIREKVVKGDKVKLSSRKTETGEYERDVSVDRIYSLDNTLLIIDEAHNITGNEQGGATVRKILDASKNLRIILLTATPMKNFADDIIELLNLLRPVNSQIERDKMFTSPRDPTMDFKPGGKEYLRNMCRGYVSYLRGADPLTFAERVDVGEIPPGLDFTKVTRCYMKPFQLDTYMRVIESFEENVDLKSNATSQAAANFVFPGLPKDRNDKGIEGYYGIEGMNIIRSQLKNNSEALNRRIASTVLADYDIKDPLSLLYITENKLLGGEIFNERYLQNFSTKFYTVLQLINDTVYGKRGNGLIFVYSNLVKVGIELFQEVLQRNGYLEYQENVRSYNLKNSTRCYYCDYTYGNHSNLPADIPKHVFYPATYLTVTGKSEDAVEQIPEEKLKIIRNVFNNAENRYGKYIKIVIGSKVMNEGITLKNIKEIHILDVHYNLGKVDQVIGRGIRFCTHAAVISEENPYPKVEVHKYVVSLENGELSTEEQLYKKAEQKYKLIKVTERILQEEAIDCPLNIHGNIFPEELEKYGDCGTADKPCPAICGYMNCKYKCGDKLLNAKYYDPERNIYRKLSKAELDYSTYNNSLASEEIEYAKSKIKEMYHLDSIYTLRDILKYVKKSYPIDKRDMFDDYYIYQALDELIPISGNDFNNFKDTLTDKYNRPGYLIYRRKYYIFQPFDENEELPMYYRRNYRPIMYNRLSLKDYIQNTTEYKKFKDSYKEESEEDTATPLFVSKNYDFDSIQEYYDSREEFDYVGIIDQESTRRKIRSTEEIKDEFKIRAKRPKFLTKKRETGVPSFKGAVCKTSKDKQMLLNISEKINLNFKETNIRTEICDTIRDKLYDLEKYSTNKDKNKFTYLIIPANHPNPKYTFPLNLEDRIQYIIDEINRETRTNVKPTVKPIKTTGAFNDIKYFTYELEFDKSMDRFREIIEKYGGVKNGNKWIITVS